MVGYVLGAGGGTGAVVDLEPLIMAELVVCWNGLETNWGGRE